MKEIFTEDYTEEYYRCNNLSTIKVSHPREISSKILTDLVRLKHYYEDKISETRIGRLHEEIYYLLDRNLLDRVIYGFVDYPYWIKGVCYTARTEEENRRSRLKNHAPGGIKYETLPESAKFTSFVVLNNNLQINPKTEKFRIHNIKRSLLSERDQWTLKPKRKIIHQERSYSVRGLGVVRDIF